MRDVSCARRCLFYSRKAPQIHTLHYFLITRSSVNSIVYDKKNRKGDDEMERRNCMMMFRKSAQIGMATALLLFLSLVIAPSGSLIAQEKSGETEISATHIIDQDIVNQQNKQIGELEDLVIKRNGKIKLAILDTGGFLGFGEKLIGISFKKASIMIPASSA